MAKSNFFTNREIARMFDEISAVYNIQGEKFYFQQRAYENAAVSIAQTGTALFDLWQQDNLAAVAGLGEKFESYIDELFRTGKVKHFAEMKEKVPAGVFPLLPLQGIGPKTAYRLATAFELASKKNAIEKLKKMAEQGKIRDLDGFGLDKETNILNAIHEWEEKQSETERMLLPEAISLAEDVMNHLRQSPAVLECLALGSIRRRAPTVGDIDIAVKTDQPEAVMEHLRKYPPLLRVLSAGPKTTMFVHSSGRQVDIKTEPPASWGSLIQHYTGDKNHNIKLRQLALQKKLSLSEHGIKHEGESLSRPVADEKEIYSTLGLQFIQPELRVGGNELTLAANAAIPDLVKLESIKGDLQVHSDFDIETSHDIGRSSVEELLRMAQSLGYEYLGLTDHNPRVSDLTKAEKRKLLQQRRDHIQAVREKMAQKDEKTPEVFVGLEVDIQPSGTLALEDELMEMLDYVVASVHSNFEQSADVATTRVLRGLEHPKVRIWGHPTGRMLERRKGLEYHWSEIVDFCAQHNKWIEVNASPRRLDVPDEFIPQIVKAGVPLVINTDAHDAETLRVMQYGVWNARRGMATAKSVVNTKKLESFRKLLFSSG